MKIVTVQRKQEAAKEIYKVGNVIYDGLIYYLVIKSREGYALVNLNSNSIFMEKGSLSALENACWGEGDELVDAELTIVE